MKEYYLDRLHWIFGYKRKNFLYCLLKTLCLVVGVPLYAVGFALEMLFTFINMLFSWIPVLNVVVLVFCKAFIFLFGGLFYINILTDIPAYKKAHPRPEEPESAEYQVLDADDDSPIENEATADDQAEQHD